MYRKTRFVCVSDTHGYTPSEAGFKLPSGDVLIHAGDLTNHGSTHELRRTIEWIAKADFEVKIIVAGQSQESHLLVSSHRENHAKKIGQFLQFFTLFNSLLKVVATRQHDITLDPNFYAEHGSSFHSQNTENPQQCIEVVTGSSSSIVFLKHQTALIRLVRPDGPNTIFKVFGSPYSQFKGTWAFGYEDADALSLWNQIPLDTDIVVTHTPPHSHRDSRSEGSPVGCKALRRILSNVRPMLAVCGHVHESRGYERVRWKSTASARRSTSRDEGEEEEEETILGVLPPMGSKKQCLVDLIGKKGGQRLENVGLAGDGAQAFLSASISGSQNALILHPSTTERLSSSRSEEANQESSQNILSHPKVNRDAARSLRTETCIINAAIVATSWPYRGGKKFHAPIVVDLELPVLNIDGVR